jgi:hypothetical protein
METTEKIVEAYVRYVKGWATIPNIKCPGQYEIDLLAINPVTLERYQIESGVSISGGFSKLTNKPYSVEDLKVRVKKPGQRRTLGYFAQRKFGAKEVVETLAKYGFKPGEYKKVIVSWGWIEDVPKAAAELGVELWDFRKIVQEIGGLSQNKQSYFTDDTMRTIQLFAKSFLEES